MLKSDFHYCSYSVKTPVQANKWLNIFIGKVNLCFLALTRSFPNITDAVAFHIAEKDE